MIGAGRPRRSKLRPRAGQVLSLGLPTAISRLASRRYCGLVPRCFGGCHVTPPAMLEAYRIGYLVTAAQMPAPR